MFVAGALPALVLVPLMIRYLSGPDAQGATAMPVTRSGRAIRETISGLFRGVQLRATLAFWIATFMGLLLIYALNTWLPEIMHAAGTQWAIRSDFCWPSIWEPSSDISRRAV